MAPPQEHSPKRTLSGSEPHKTVCGFPEMCKSPRQMALYSTAGPADGAGLTLEADS